MSEAQIQTKIKKALLSSGWFVTKIIACSTNGFPDLLAIKCGRTVVIECKLPGQKPKPLQEYVHAQLRKQNIEVIVAQQLKDISHLCPLEINTCSQQPKHTSQKTSALLQPIRQK